MGQNKEQYFSQKERLKRSLTYFKDVLFDVRENLRVGLMPEIMLETERRSHNFDIILDDDDIVDLVKSFEQKLDDKIQETEKEIKEL